jgi:hypothetical protein
VLLGFYHGNGELILLKWDVVLLSIPLHENTRDVLPCYRKPVVIVDCGRILGCSSKMQNCVLKFRFLAAWNMLKIVRFEGFFLRPWLWRMPSSGMWRRVDIVQSAATCSHWLLALKMEAISPSETSVYTISTRRHISEDGILHALNSFRCVLKFVSCSLFQNLGSGVQSQCYRD